MGVKSASWSLIVVVAGLQTGLAADPSVISTLPYSSRTLGYQSYSATTRGDIRTVGMAGATVGLGDTFAAAGDNPAGLAMTMNVGDTHASSNSIRDGSVQSSAASISAASIGAALQASDWGLSLGSLNTWGEGQFYSIPAGGGAFWDPQNIDLFTREYRLGFARRMDHSKLSVGVQIRWGVFRQSIGPSSNEFDNPDKVTTAVGATLGVLYHLPKHFLVGFSLSSPMRYEPGPTAPGFTLLPGFAQAAQTPLKAGVGIGYIPNRLFRADFTLQFVDATPNTALLSDQGTLTGTHSTLEPRLGAAYTFGDFRSMRATGFLGTYLEPSRVFQHATRLHGTGGVELKWSFMNFGFGFDIADDYQNRLASIGVDPFAVMERLGLIPRTPPQRAKGLFPRVNYLSNEGLPSALSDTPEKTGDSEPGIDPIAVGTAIPKKIGEKVRTFKPGQVLDTLRELPSDIGKDLKEVGDEIQKKLKE